MTEPALLDPAFFDLPSPFPDLDFPLPSDLAADGLPLPDLDFYFDFDFSVDDFLRPPVPPAPGSHDGSAVPPDPGNSSSTSSPETGRCSGSSVVTVQEEKGSRGPKRKKERDDNDGNGPAKADSNVSSNPRSGKVRRSDKDNSVSSGGFTVGGGEDEKRKARLMRNRESAHLSRQRKKLYVEELEEKVKSMHSAINEMNAKLSFVIAENASLRQQLGANGPLAVGPPPGAMGVAHLPWVPGYALRPQGSRVPLVPIPRLKPQQPAPALKVKNAGSKKGDGRIKKVASISLLSLLFVMLIFGSIAPDSRERFEEGLGISSNGIIRRTRGRVLAVSGGINSVNDTERVGLCDGKMTLEEGGLDRKCQSRTIVAQKGSESILNQNASETLPALLYVSRNGKHVKINGNLIIHSVLASERAIAHMSKDQARQSEDTSLEISPYLAPSEDADRKHSKSHKISYEHAMALAPGYTDGPLPQWFSEGMAGPMLSFGMCTEVFQFEVSPIASIHPGGIAPATSAINSTINSTEKAPLSPHSGRIKNRRIMYSDPIPLPGATLNETERLEATSANGSNKPASSVVVSVLADPREVEGDSDSDRRISPKSLSRVFVVVLLDSVKYITYSCILPLKNSGPHLVN